jgi:hypothetical protein
MERKEMVSELLSPKPGGMCYRHNFGWARRWAASKMGSEDNYNGLANRLQRGRFKARIGHVSR